MTKPTWGEEKKYWKEGYKLIAGVDEAGRGAWAGPLVAAAVILPKGFRASGLNDSKKLTSSQREKLFEIIIRQAVAYQAVIIPVEEIDRHGVSRANTKALYESAKRLKISPDFILVDGFNIDYSPIRSKHVVRGDERVMSIAAASIIAKVTRDHLMVELHKKYPFYRFDMHKGYGTALHHQLIKKFGPNSFHRKSFTPIRNIVKIKKYPAFSKAGC